MMPAMANMNMISMFQPISVRNAVSPGVVHIAERCVMANTQPFQVSLMKSMPNKVKAAKMGSQLPLDRALLISFA